MTRHVVLLFDERVELPGLAALEAEFIQTLASNSADQIETYRENMDISPFGSDSYRTLLWHLATIRTDTVNGRYRTNSGQRATPEADASVANDPKLGRYLMSQNCEAGFSPYENARLSRYDALS